MMQGTLGFRGKNAYAYVFACPLLAACTVTAVGDGSGGGGDPGISVSDVSPPAGDYGATITAHGARLVSSGAGVFGTSPDGERVTILGPMSASTAATTRGPQTGQTVAPPDDAPLTFRFPFPAEGAMTLEVPGRDPIALGSFTPSFTPGQPLVTSGETVLGASALGGSVAALVDGPAGVGFEIWDAGAAPRFVAIDPKPASGMSAVVRTNAGAVEAILYQGTTVSLVMFDGTTAHAVPYTDVGGTLVGAGTDDVGLVFVVRTSDGKIARARGAPPTATIDGDAVAIPQTSTQYSTMAISGDGSVVLAWSSPGGDTFDDKADFYMSGLGTHDTAFSAPLALAALDDDASSLSASVDGGLVSLSYCAVDSDLFSSTVETHCGSTLTMDGKTSLSADGQTVRAASMAGGTLTTAFCDGNDVAVIQGGAGAPTNAIYPCSGVKMDALVATPSGSALLVEANGKLWAAHPR